MNTTDTKRIPLSMKKAGTKSVWEQILTWLAQYCRQEFHWRQKPKQKNFFFLFFSLFIEGSTLRELWQLHRGNYSEKALFPNNYLFRFQWEILTRNRSLKINLKFKPNYDISLCVMQTSVCVVCLVNRLKTQCGERTEKRQLEKLRQNPRVIEMLLVDMNIWKDRS